MYSLLLIEDDHAIREMLSMFLTANQYQVYEVEDGQQALAKLNEVTVDLVVLDWMLPDTNGLKLLQEIRAIPVHKELPILMLTARAEESDKIKGLDVGADDYMTKPVSLKELHSRIKALIRRSQGLTTEQLLHYAGITINPQNENVSINDSQVTINGMEYSLLHFFMKKPDRLFSRAQLLDHVWGQTVYVEERTVDVHIMRLRKTLKAYGLDKILQTVRGKGYRLVDLKSAPHAVSTSQLGSK